MLVMIIFFLIIEWRGRNWQYALQHFALAKPQALRWAFYCLLVFLILVLKPTVEAPFIYFQF